jgi:large subunit ribosomal protein L22
MSRANQPKSVPVAISRLRGVRVSPQKARLVMDLVRGQGVAKALNTLSFQKQKTARLAEKLIRSAVANAEDVANADVDSLYVSEVYVDSGVTLKRSMPRARGRATPIRKRCSHITVALGVANV